MNKNIKYPQKFPANDKILNQIINKLNLADTVHKIGSGKEYLTYVRIILFI